MVGKGVLRVCRVCQGCADSRTRPGRLPRENVRWRALLHMTLTFPRDVDERAGRAYMKRAHTHYLTDV